MSHIPETPRRDVGVLSAAAALPSTQRDGVGIGYFVGINRFADPQLNPLRFAVNDAIDFAHAFIVKLLLLDPTRSFISIDQDPIDEDRRRKLAELLAAGVKREQPSKSALLYRLHDLTSLPAQRLFVTLSTHGFVDSIVPADGYATSADLLTDTAIPIARLNQLLGRSPAKLQLVYIDACRNEPLIVDPGRKSIPAGPLSQLIDTHEGRAVIRSCESRQFSYEFEELGNGLSAHYVLRALGLKARPPQDPVAEAAESLADGSITLAGVMGYATGAANRFLSHRGHAGGRQSPCLDAPERLRHLPLAIDPDRLAWLEQQQTQAAAMQRHQRQAIEELIARLQSMVNYDGGPFGPEQFRLARDLLKEKRLVAAEKLQNFRLRAQDFAEARIDDETWVAIVERLGGAVAAPTAPHLHTRPPPATVPATPRKITNSIGMTLIEILPGAFQMGSPKDEAGREGYDGADETQHDVKIIKPFMMGTHMVTHRQFAAFANASGYNTVAEIEGWSYGYVDSKWEKVDGLSWRKPGFEQDDNHPVVCVSWKDAQACIKWLQQKEAEPYRLPTEAQWEYACRAGTTTPFHFGVTLSTDKANYNGNNMYSSGRKGVYRQKTTPVGSFPPNPWGLFDMHGNALEWCEDWFGAYPNGEAIDPAGPVDGAARVLRGGSWVSSPSDCRAAYRFRFAAVRGYDFTGFRVCLDF